MESEALAAGPGPARQGLPASGPPWTSAAVSSMAGAPWTPGPANTHRWLTVLRFKRHFPKLFTSLRKERGHLTSYYTPHRAGGQAATSVSRSRIRERSEEGVGRDPVP